MTLHNLVYVHYNLKLRERSIRKNPIDYTLINLDYIFWREVVNEWVSQKAPVLNQDFLRGTVADIDDDEVVVAPNEGDMVVDMDTDYEYEDEKQDDEETDGIIENDWQVQSSRNVKERNIIRCPMHREMIH
ncbi:hypothetical protein AMTRI_Chr12g236380 [Amborella trichopoda]|uniref:Uncharacterized protein n=1 Tax=Amborella trichopoda TaxID=13333 RepID=W1NPR3_AMBTC|nr:hypothetical protein AMTR_s00093p00088560 [Amborella trichopoda]